LRELDVPADRIRVVVNQLRAGLFDGDAASQIRAALSRYLGVEPVAFIPYDRAALDASTFVTRSIAEVCPGSPAGRALADLTRSMLGIPAQRVRRWRRRRAQTLRAPGLITPRAVTEP
jgi:Flp pilus assembly CpaE family ATPase